MQRLLDKQMFIGIGAQKTGTTWLADYLDEHPEVFISPYKELHFFDKYHSIEGFNVLTEKIKKRTIEKIQRLPRGIEYLRINFLRLAMRYDDSFYLKYFNELIHDEKVYGEITPSYSMLDKIGFEKIKETCGDPKIIFIMRNPIERFWSQLKYSVRHKEDIDPLTIFEKALDDKSFIYRGNYKRTIEELEKVFDNKQILYLFYENLFNENSANDEIRKITDFLGIKFRKPQTNRVVLSTKALTLPPNYRKAALKKHAEVYRYVLDRFEDVPESWHRDYEAL